jgi:hypothetical protein
MPYPNRFSTIALYICVFIYFFTFFYSIALAVIAASFFIKSLAQGSSLSLCDANLTNTSFVNDTTVCDVIYPVMYVSYIIIAIFAFLAIFVYFALRCHEDFLSDGEGYGSSDLFCVKKNNIDLIVLLATAFFWVVLTAPVYAKCVLKEFVTNCSLEIVFRLGCWVISNVGSVGILTVWVLFVFGGANKRLKEARMQTGEALAKTSLHLAGSNSSHNLASSEPVELSSFVSSDLRVGFNDLTLEVNEKNDGIVDLMEIVNLSDSERKISLS